MSNKADSLTEYARNGYHGNANPHLATSPKWYAHALGQWLHGEGYPIPTDVRMGRGDSIRCDGARFMFTVAKGRIQFVKEIQS